MKIILIIFQGIPVFFFIKTFNGMLNKELIISYTIFCMWNIVTSCCILKAWCASRGTKFPPIRKVVYFCILWYYTLFLSIFLDYKWILYSIISEIIIKRLCSLKKVNSSMESKL